MILETKEEKYLQFKIRANHIISKDKNDKDYKFFNWEIFKNEKFFITDLKTIEGDNLQSLSHAINDAKKNIDIFIRLKISID